MPAGGARIEISLCLPSRTSGTRQSLAEPGSGPLGRLGGAMPYSSVCAAPRCLVRDQGGDKTSQPGVWESASATRLDRELMAIVAGQPV